MEINTSLLEEFEKTINTIHPERGKIPINMLGFGEISLVFELVADPRIAYKRLPIFDTETQVQRHMLAYKRYRQILKRLEISVPLEDSVWFRSEKGNIVLYCAQEKIPVETIGNKIIHQLSKEEVELLIHLIMREMQKIWAFNNRSKTFKVGLDGQISNWAVKGYNPRKPQISEGDELIYFDTSTPMFRINNVDAMEPVLFLKSAPFFLRWLLKALFLDDVVGRYYDLRLVTIDLIANFFKEQLPQLIPGLIKIINDFFSNEVAELNITPITYKEVHDYYEEDKQIWVIFQNARLIDRYIQTKLFRKQYDFYLPEKIKR